MQKQCQGNSVEVRRNRRQRMSSIFPEWREVRDGTDVSAGGRHQLSAGKAGGGKQGNEPALSFLFSFLQSGQMGYFLDILAINGHIGFVSHTNVCLTSEFRVYVLKAI